MDDELDPRLNPYRPDLAAAELQGKVEAEAFAKPRPMTVQVPVLDLYEQPNRSSLASQLLFGEAFDVFELGPDFAWGQSRLDRYVGYVPRDRLGAASTPNEKITSLIGHVYSEPNFKSAPTATLSYMSRIARSAQSGDFLQTKNGFVSTKHVGNCAKDFVAEAQRFIGLPYLWGGRSAFGLDCSALVQLSLQACGQACLRDSDMQLADLGELLPDGSDYIRGDLLFWKGHVAIVSDPTTILHANVHAMKVSLEPIETAISRIAKTDGPVIAHKRF